MSSWTSLWVMLEQVGHICYVSAFGKAHTWVWLSDVRTPFTATKSMLHNQICSCHSILIVPESQTALDWVYTQQSCVKLWCRSNPCPTVTKQLHRKSDRDLEPKEERQGQWWQEKKSSPRCHAEETLRVTRIKQEAIQSWVTWYSEIMSRLGVFHAPNTHTSTNQLNKR